MKRLAVAAFAALAVGLGLCAVSQFRAQSPFSRGQMGAAVRLLSDDR